MFEEPPLSFDDVLVQETGYLFPAGTEPVSWTMLLQYRAAGGNLVRRERRARLGPRSVDRRVELLRARRRTRGFLARRCCNTPVLTNIGIVLSTPRRT